MTKSQEEQNQEELRNRQIAEQKRAAAQAQSNQQNQVNPNPNVGNVPQQVQVQPANTATGAQATIQQNIEGDEQAQLTNDKLSLLKRIVGLASPVYEEKQETEEQKDADGNVNQVPVTRKEITGYNYYAVNGQDFKEWVQQAFGGDITIDEKENKINYNKPVEEIKYTEPQKPQEENLPKGVRTETGNENKNNAQVQLKKQ